MDFKSLLRRRNSSGYLGDNRWLSAERSDIKIEQAMRFAQVDAGRSYNGDQNKSASFSYTAI